METTDCKNDICNMALSLLRENAIMNIDYSEPSGDTERVLNLWYDISRKECIIDVNPTFAIKRETVAKEEDIVINNVKYNAFRIPSDCLRVLDIENTDNEESEYILEGEYVYCGSNDTINIRYASDQHFLNSSNTKFNICLSYYIAYNICGQIQNNQQLQQFFLQLKQQKQSETRTYYLNEVKPYFEKKKQWRRW
jgi:hypothetical protein